MSYWPDLDESRFADGSVAGMYNYVDSEGHLQTVQYVADAQGFRVAGTNIPGEATNIFDPFCSSHKIE